MSVCPPQRRLSERRAECPLCGGTGWINRPGNETDDERSARRVAAVLTGGAGAPLACPYCSGFGDEIIYEVEESA